MSKRKRHDYPQWWNMGNVNQGGSNDTGLVTTFNSPIPRINTRGRSSTVMEILKMEVVIIPGAIAVSAGNEYAVAVKSANALQTTPLLLAADPSVLALAVIDLVTNSTPQSTTVIPKMDIDLTDGDGHGILAAGDNLFVEFITANTASHGAVANVRLLFRFQEVSVEDFVGIVQGQLT
jgi:hypothetical protein